MREIATRDVLWAIGSCCAIHRIPFDARLLAASLAPPCGSTTLVEKCRELGFEVQARGLSLAKIERHARAGTVLLLLDASAGAPALALVQGFAAGSITWFPAGSSDARTTPLAEFAPRYSGHAAAASASLEK